MGVGGDGIAAHGFGADAETELDFFQGDGVGGLANGFDARAADALHEQRGAIERNAGIEADVAGEDVGIEAGLGYATGDDRADILGWYFRALEEGAGGFNAEVGGGDEA